MRKTRWIAAGGVLLFAFSMASSPASAAPVPTPPVVTPGVGDLGAPLVYGPDGTAPLGRIKANITDPNWRAKLVAPPLGARPSPRASAHPRPYGGETALGQVINAGPNAYYLCTMGIGAQSTSGQRYNVLAGHCLRNTSGPPAGTEAGDGKWYYPESTIANNISPGPAQYQYDSTGDQGALRTNPTVWTPTRQVKSQSALYTITAAGNPVLGENICLVLGHSKRTTCGFSSDIDAQKQWSYSDGTSHGNMGIVQSSNVAGCPILGDSGSPALAGTEATGWLSASFTDGRNCWMWVTQLGHVFSRYSLFLAPAS